MMTCTSERSGMASSGMCRTEYTPINNSVAVVSRTMNLFWSENSMIRLSMASVELDERRRNDSAHEPHPLRAYAKTIAGQEAYFKQNNPHPLPAPQPLRQAGDPLPSDGRGNNKTRRSQLPKRLGTPTGGGRFSLSHPMGEGRGEGDSAPKSEVVFARVLNDEFP